MKNYFNETVNHIKGNWILILFAFIFIAVCFAIDSVLGGAATGTSLAMAGGGSQFRNAQVADGAGWDRKYSIANAFAALLENVYEVVSDEETKIKGWYDSSTTFATNKANYDGFPIGSKIIDIQAKKEYLHDTPTTWLSVTFA